MYGGMIIMENGAVQIYYGEGHGKTNVAIGSAICAACDGKRYSVPKG